MLSAAFRGDTRAGTLKDFQERLLHTLTRNVPGNRGVVPFAGDLIDLVNVDNTLLGLFNVVVRRLKKIENDVRDVFPDVTRLGKGRRIHDGKRHFQQTGKGLGKKGLTATSGTHEKDVTLLKLHIRGFTGLGRIDPFVVVVDRYRQGLFSLVLSDNKIIENILNF